MTKPVPSRRRNAAIAKLCLGLALASFGAGATHATTPPTPSMAPIVNHNIAIDLGTDQLTVRFVAPGIVHVQHRHAGATDTPALVIDRDATLPGFEPRSVC